MNKNFILGMVVGVAACSLAVISIGLGIVSLSNSSANIEWDGGCNSYSDPNCNPTGGTSIPSSNRWSWSWPSWGRSNVGSYGGQGQFYDMWGNPMGKGFRPVDGEYVP